jgi:hypothetical protein
VAALLARALAPRVAGCRHLHPPIVIADCRGPWSSPPADLRTRAPAWRSSVSRRRIYPSTVGASAC